MIGKRKGNIPVAQTGVQAIGQLVIFRLQNPIEGQSGLQICMNDLPHHAQDVHIRCQQLNMPVKKTFQIRRQRAFTVSQGGRVFIAKAWGIPIAAASLLLK